MAGTLTQKENTIVQDQMRHEDVCIRKYKNYSREVSQTLGSLLNEIGRQEQQHYDTLNSLLSGTSGQQGTSRQSPGQQGMPSQPMQSQGWPPSDGQIGQTQPKGGVLGPIGSGTSSGNQSAGGQANASGSQGPAQTQGETPVIRDLLMTEQFVSGSYDKAVFDSVNPQLRQTLQHIQDEEQEHGRKLKSYMDQKGMTQQQ